MSKYPKFPVIVLAVLCTALLIFGCAGYSTQYGDITTNVSASALGINGGLGIENAVGMIYSCEEDLTAEQLDAVKTVIEKRLNAIGITDHTVAYDAESNSFEVEVARGPKSTYTVSDLYDGLSASGLLEVYDSSEKDADGKPTGELICTNDEPVLATTSTEQYMNSLVKYNLTLKFTGAAKQAIKEYTEKKLESGSDGVYSVWLDGEMLNSRAFNKVISNGVLEAGNASYSYGGSSGSYDSQAMIITGGRIESELKGITMLSFSEPDRSVNYKAVLYGMAAVCVLCAVYWIVRYRLLGLAAVISLAGYLGTVIMIMTGSFYSLGIYLSVTGLGAFVACTLAVLLCTSYMLRGIRLNVAVVSPFRAIDSFCKVRTGGLFAALAVIAAGAVAANQLKLTSLYTIILPAAICCCAGLLFMFWVFRACAKSFTGYKAFKSARLYGGNEA